MSTANARVSTPEVLPFVTNGPSTGLRRLTSLSEPFEGLFSAFGEVYRDPSTATLRAVPSSKAFHRLVDSSYELEAAVTAIAVLRGAAVYASGTRSS